VQGTIKEYDAEARTGSLLTDDRTEIAIDDRSVSSDTIRMLRLGQRVRFETVEQDGRTVARSLTLVTFEEPRAPR
jgi:cold shock CspA family protein